MAMPDLTGHPVTVSKIPSSREIKAKAAVPPGPCAYCGSPKAEDVDHMIPRGRGGQATPDNLVRACKRCNHEKGTRTVEEWKQSRLIRGLPWPPSPTQERVLAARRNDPRFDPAGPALVYVLIADEIASRIGDGTYLPGYRLPSETDLAAEFGCARMTARRAVRELRARELIRTFHGKGSYVLAAAG